MSKIFYLTFALGIFAFASCQEEDFGYKSYEPDKAETDYSLRFANRDAVKVNISTETPGAPYYVYFENPIGEDGVSTGATAYLMGVTPIETTLSVPRHVKSLFVASPNREVRELPVGDIKIEDKNLMSAVATTRVNTESAPYALPAGTTTPYYVEEWNASTCLMPNPDCTDAVVNFAHSNFPSSASGTSLIKWDYITKNTDLVVPTADAGYTAVWITWLGMGTGDQKCRVWFYVYPENQTFSANPDIPLYGRAVSIDAIKGKPNRVDPLFDSAEDAIGTAVFVGYVKSGYRIGFAYQCYEANGQQAKIRYTTPDWNRETVGNNQSDYVAGGLCVNQNIDGNNYNIVGLERETWHNVGNSIPPDHDFNDALLLIETSLPVKPKEEVPLDPPVEVNFAKGYYLFEDLNGSAASNDNDFNDVVIYYERTITTTNGEKQYDSSGNIVSDTKQYWCNFKVDLLANACNNTNAVGLYQKKPNTAAKTFILFDNITGFENNMSVAGPYNDESRFVSVENLSMASKDDVILPFLRSVPKSGKDYNYTPDGTAQYADVANRYNIYSTTYGTAEAPYALEIPFVDGDNPFRWMKEGEPIGKGYENWKTAADWYKNPTNASYLVPRAEGTTKY